MWVGRDELEIRNGRVLFPFFFFFFYASYKSAADTIISLPPVSLVIREQKSGRACFGTKGRGYGAWNRRKEMRFEIAQSRRGLRLPPCNHVRASYALFADSLGWLDERQGIRD